MIKIQPIEIGQDLYMVFQPICYGEENNKIFSSVIVTDVDNYNNTITVEIKDESINLKEKKYLFFTKQYPFKPHKRILCANVSLYISHNDYLRIKNLKPKIEKIKKSIENKISLISDDDIKKFEELLEIQHEIPEPPKMREIRENSDIPIQYDEYGNEIKKSNNFINIIKNIKRLFH